MLHFQRVKSVTPVHSQRERERERERDKSFTPYVHLHTGSVKSFTLCSFTWRARK